MSEMKSAQKWWNEHRESEKRLGAGWLLDLIKAVQEDAYQAGLKAPKALGPQLKGGEDE